MKGISEIIATILMLMITIGVSGTAYLFINNIFTQQSQGIEVLDAYCAHIGGITNSTILIRNAGTGSINTSAITVVQLEPVSTVDVKWDSTLVASGNTVTLYDECEGSGSRVCTYRVVPPQGRSVSVPLRCT